MTAASLARWVRARLGPTDPGFTAGNPLRITLEDNQTLSFQVQAAEIGIECLSGTVWVTREGDFDGHVLSAGDAFASPPGGRLAIMAFCTSRLEILKSGPAQRIPLFRAGARPLPGRTRS